jgi:hypothetical protein
MSHNNLLYNKTTPASFLNWLEFQEKLTTDFNVNFKKYQSYIKDWAKINNSKHDDSKNFFNQLYIDLLREITLNFTTEEEKRFLINFDYTKIDNLDIVLPFFIDKLKGICLFYSSKREYLKDRAALLPVKGTNISLKRVIKSIILDSVESKSIQKEIEGRVKFPSLSAINKNLEIKIEELYDGSEYLNKNSFTDNISAFGNTDIDKNLYLDFKQAIIEAIKNYPLYINTLLNAFSINYILSGTELNYLKERDFINYISTLSSKDLSLNIKKRLAPKYLSSDFYYLSVGETITDISSGLIFSTLPLTGHSTQNLTNRDYPTVAAVQSLDNLYAAYEIGKFFVPNYSGVLQYSTFNKKAYINYKKLTPNSIYIFPDPEIVESEREDFPLIYKVDVSWSKVGSEGGFRFGDVISDNHFNRFYPYESMSQDNINQPYGLSKSVDNVNFWSGDRDTIWTENKLWPGLDEVEELPLEERTNSLLIDKGTLTDWFSDIYGNEFGLYKKLNNDTSLYDKRNLIQGNLYVKNTVTNLVSSFNNFFTTLYLKYPEKIGKELRGKFNSFYLIKNVLVIETENYVILDSYEFDLSSGKALNTLLPGIYIPKFEINSNLEKFINSYYVEENNTLFLCFLKLLPSLSASNYKSIYPVIYKIDVDTLNFEQKFPGLTFDATVYSLSSNLLKDFPEIDLRYIEGGKFSYKDKFNVYNLTYIAYNLNEIPFLVNEQFTLNENKNEFTAYLPVLNKPYFYTHDVNFSNPTVDNTLRLAGTYSELIGSKDKVYFNWNVIDTGNDNFHFCSNINPVFINIPGVHYVHFDWDLYVGGNIFIGCENLQVIYTDNINIITYSNGTSAVRLEEEEVLYKIKDYTFKGYSFSLSAFRPYNTNGGVVKFEIGSNADNFNDIFCDDLYNVYRRVTIVKGGSGTGLVTSDPFCINCGDLCDIIYPLYSTITLIPSTNSDNTFAGWLGTPCEGVAGNCILNVTGNTTVTAVFNKIPEYTLELKTFLPNTSVSTLDGLINCTTSCSAIYKDGSLVGVSASPAPIGYDFNGFKGSNCSLNNPCGIIMNNNYSLTASYVSAANTIKLTKAFNGVQNSDESTGYIYCSLSPEELIYNKVSLSAMRGTFVTISAYIDKPNTFDYFSGNPCNSPDNVCSFNLTDNVSITGFFNLPYYTVSVKNSGGGVFYTMSEDKKLNCGTGGLRKKKCSTRYLSGSLVSVSAIAIGYPDNGILSLATNTDSIQSVEEDGNEILSLNFMVTDNTTITALGIAKTYNSLTIIKLGSNLPSVKVTVPDLITYTIPSTFNRDTFTYARGTNFIIDPNLNSMPGTCTYLYTTGYSGLFYNYEQGLGFNISDSLNTSLTSVSMFIGEEFNVQGGIINIQNNGAPYYIDLNNPGSLLKLQNNEAYLTLMDNATAYVVYKI